jgi:hypothetical protein
MSVRNAAISFCSAFGCVQYVGTVGVPDFDPLSLQPAKARALVAAVSRSSVRRLMEPVLEVVLVMSISFGSSLALDGSG